MLTEHILRTPKLMKVSKISVRKHMDECMALYFATVFIEAKFLAANRNFISRKTTHNIDMHAADFFVCLARMPTIFISI